MRYVAALPKRFVADCRGVTSTLMALSFMGMLGFAGLATEVGLWYVKKRSMQSAADSAAFSAAIALSTGLFQTEAQSVAGDIRFRRRQRRDDRYRQQSTDLRSKHKRVGSRGHHLPATDLHDRQTLSQ